MKNQVPNFEDFVNEEQINEKSISNDLADELSNLMSRIDTGFGIDKKSKEKHNNGELLAMFLTPIFQSALANLDSKERSSFKKGFKI